MAMASGWVSRVIFTLDSHPKSEVPATSCIVLDGAVIIQLLKPATAKSFNEYA